MGRWPLKMTRSKQESTATIKLVNLATKRDSVFMAFSSGWDAQQPHSGGRTPFLLILFGCGSAALGSNIVIVHDERRLRIFPAVKVHANQLAW